MPGISPGTSPGADLRLPRPDINWAIKHMPLTARAVEELAPVLAGKRLAMCLHIEPKTAALVTLLARAGTRISLTGSPGTTHDDVADALRGEGVAVPGVRAALFGYGPCGKGVADTLAHLGARVAVCEIDPMRALHAIMSGHRVGPSVDVVSDAQVVFMATGHPEVIGAAELDALPDGAVLAGVGHFPWELDRDALTASTLRTVEYGDTSRRRGYVLADGREVVLLDDGRMLNLTAANGNPIQAMDLGLTLQARSLAAVCAGDLAAGLQSVPTHIEQRIASDLVDLLSGPDRSGRR
ncbi:hypothetical protein [Streptomyces sp. NPDC047315]|uniref:hypothetical protein n=1 Tax=Streptomyces sp. NPDC047315 TaxID=3155142 RepID=UPI0033EFB58A